MRISAVLACAIGVATATEAQQWPSQRRGYEATTLEADRIEQRFSRFSDGILLDNVMINGQGPYRFLLDTGAEGAGRIDLALAEQLDLAHVGQQQNIHVIEGSRDASVMRADTLSIGSLSFSGVELLSGDYAQIAGPGYPPIHGILGFHLFNEYLFTIDYPARTISVQPGELPPSDGRTILDIISDDEDPEIEVSVGERKLKALLDTGAMNHFAVPDSEAQNLNFAEEPVVRGRQGNAELRVGNLADTVRIGEFEFEGLQTYMTSALNQSIVGARVLAQLRVTYDQKNARVRVERPAPRPRYGLAFGWRGEGPWIFMGVDPDTIAAKAGLLPTDTILSVNGTPFATIDRELLLRTLDEPTVVIVVDRGGENIEFRLSWE